MLRDGTGTPLRLLPWTTPEGRPCYLSTDDPDSRLSRLADAVEAELIESAETVLAAARTLLRQPALEERELRFAGMRLTEALGDALRIAESRGARLAED